MLLKWEYELRDGFLTLTCDRTGVALSEKVDVENPKNTVAIFRSWGRKYRFPVTVGHDFEIFDYAAKISAN